LYRGVSLWYFHKCIHCTLIKFSPLLLSPLPHFLHF
jgi:hypothetical protein